MSDYPDWMKTLPPEFWLDKEVLALIEEWRRKRCDMKGTALCDYYRDKKVCHYGGTHGVEKCPYGKKLRYEEE